MTQSREIGSTATSTITTSLLSGFLGGLADTLATHPISIIKTRSQQHLPFTLNPTSLCRGLPANMASALPITMLQVGLNDGLSTLYPDTEQLTKSKQFTAAFAAGITSSLFIAPTEMIILYQGKYECSAKNAYKHAVSTQKNLAIFRGLSSVAIREGIYTTSTFALRPTIKPIFNNYINNDNAASLLAGSASGLFASVITQPIDTIKTIQQSPHFPQANSALEAAKAIYHKNGWRGFFKGGFARGVSVISGVTLVADIKERVENYDRRKMICKPDL